MKMALPSLSKEALINGLLNHSEKIVGGLILLVSLWLVWGGITAIRVQSAPADLSADKIVAKAGEALAHIDSQQDPPADKLLEAAGLPDSLGTWLTPGAKDRRSVILSRPLFEEQTRRSQPEVFPVEDLRAVAGVAALAVPGKMDGRDGRPARPEERPPNPSFDPLAGLLPGAATAEEEDDPAENVPPARVVPYVVVTGLIPHEKQCAEYRDRFGGASFSDPQRDRPKWSDYLVERADVTDGSDPTWERINLRALNPESSGFQNDSLPKPFFLPPEDQSDLGGLAYAWPLPKLAVAWWGLESIHPWAFAEWRRSGQDLGYCAYRVFRFIDLSVKSGRVYRYRVRISVLNPNFGVPAQHLARADLAMAMKLPSPASNETQPVSIPAALEVLARVPPTKPNKPEKAEVLVLWPHEKTGNFALHSVTTEPGGIVSVQRKIEPVEDDARGRGKSVRGRRETATEPVPIGMLLDFIGQQVPAQLNSNPATGRRGKKSPPAEPFELLLLDEDGQLRWADQIGSEEKHRLYAETLPEALRSVPEESAARDGDAAPISPGPK